MRKFKKLVVTVGALAALAVGGAAFAQAQNASTPITAPTHQSVGEETSPGDSDSASGQNEAPRFRLQGRHSRWACRAC
jgi:hypothetical protein